MSDDTAIANAVSQYIQMHRFIEISAHGVSMYPYIRSGDLCRFVQFSPGEVKVGDVILFRNQRNLLVGHRVIQRIVKDGAIELICKGDTNRSPDTPVDTTQVVARLMAITRGKRYIDERSASRRFWTWLILKAPFVSNGCRKWIVHKQIWEDRILKVRRVFNRLVSYTNER